MSTNDWSLSWPTEDELHEALELSSQRKLCMAFKIDRATLSNHITGKRLQVAGEPVGGKKKTSNAPADACTIEVGKLSASVEFTEQTMDPNTVPTDAELLKKANLDAEIWEVSSRRSSVWEAQAEFGETKTLRSFRVGFSRVKESAADAILPAFGGKPVSIKAAARRKATERDTELVIVVSDFHAPYHDQELLDTTCQLLMESQPQRLIINGDLVDFPTTGRHRKTTNNCQASANECIQAGGEILAQLRAAVPADTIVQFLPGNHDGWLSNYILGEAGAAYNLCVSGSDVPVWSLRNLLQLDSMNIEMVGTDDQWQHAAVQLTPLLVVRHGVSVRAGSAASVIANMKSSDFASITGHTHRMGLATKTVWAADGSHKVIQGAEIGGMFKMPTCGTDWPTYTAAHNMDWAPGFASVEIEGDGHFSIDLASWQNGTLMWRGGRY